jgi:hypothetical protein
MLKNIFKVKDVNKPEIAVFHSCSHLGTSTVLVFYGFKAYRSFTSNGFWLPSEQTALNHHIV